MMTVMTEAMKRAGRCRVMQEKEEILLCSRHIQEEDDEAYCDAFHDALSAYTAYTPHTPPESPTSQAPATPDAPTDDFFILFWNACGLNRSK